MALEAGKDVLVEKPLTLSSREGYELVELAKSRGLVLHVGHVFRFNSALLAARDMLKRGELGKLFYIRIQWTDEAFFSDRDIIFDLGPHPVDILNQLVGLWPDQLSGMARGFRGDGGEVAYIIAEFPNDLFAHIELSWLHPHKVREVTVVGSAGTLVVDCLSQRLFLNKRESRSEIPISASNTIACEITNFVDCIAQRDTPSESGLVGARTVEVLESIRSSIWDKPLPVVFTRPDRISADFVVDVLQALNMKSTAESELHTDAELQRVLSLLLNSGLVRRVASEHKLHYQITERGLNFINGCKEISRKPDPELASPSMKSVRRENLQP